MVYDFGVSCCQHIGSSKKDGSRKHSNAPPESSADGFAASEELDDVNSLKQ